MLCDKCGKERAEHYKKTVVNGQQCFLHLCTNCLNNLNKTGYTIAKIGENLKTEQKKDENKICPVCFSSLASIKKTGLIGCSKCYEIFKEDILKNIKNIQNSTIHIGKKK